MKRRNLLKKAIYGSTALAASNAFAQRAMAADGDIKRFIIWWVPEGAAQQAFWPARGPGALAINQNASINGKHPKSNGGSINNYRSADMGTYCLQPMQRHLNDFSILSGFVNNGESDSTDPHAKVISTALTGGIFNQGSIDQYLGDYLKGDSPFPTILSSCFGEKLKIGVPTSYACPWRSKTGQAANLSWNPITTYNHIFPDGIPKSGDGGQGGNVNHRLESRLLVLDSVAERLKAVMCEGGREAKERMEGYIESFEKIEKQTQRLKELDSQGSGADVSVDIPNGWETISEDNKYWQDPNNFEALMKIQMDTTIAAFALDRTRVSMMQFAASGFDNAPIKGEHYQKIAGIEGYSDDHTLGHNDEPRRRRDQARVFRWYYDKLAYFIDQLKATPDSDGNSLFDNTLIMCCSEFGMYNHRPHDIPYLLAGNPGGVFKHGQYYDAFSGGHRKHSDLFLGVARALGADMAEFGQSSNPYTGMLV